MLSVLKVLAVITFDVISERMREEKKELDKVIIYVQCLTDHRYHLLDKFERNVFKLRLLGKQNFLITILFAHVSSS